MNTGEARTGRAGAGPSVYVGPDREHFGAEQAGAFVEAVERGGGGVVARAEEAEAIVWIGSDKPGLPALLHPGVRWVQLPSAGVEPWTAGGLLDRERIFTSAAGAYAGTVAEHALALMLAGARRFPESYAEDEEVLGGPSSTRARSYSASEVYGEFKGPHALR